jgi:hypothetical protein
MTRASGLLLPDGTGTIARAASSESVSGGFSF